jgi:hypothetical protein
VSAKRTVLDYDDVFTRGIDSPRVFVLSDAFRRALLQLADRLYWESAWTAVLNDADWALIDEGHRVLIEGSEVPEGEMCEHCDLIPEILAQLQELNNMNINVTSGGCGCGCGGCGQSQPCDTTDIDDGDVSTPPGDDQDGDTGLANKCNSANYLVYALRLAVINAVTQTYSAYDSWWHNLWFGLGDEIGSIQWAIWSAIRSWFINRSIGEFTSNFDPLFDNLVCTLYNSPSTNAARGNLDNALNQLPIPWRYVTRALTGNMPYIIMFQPGIISLPPGFENRQCCGSIPPAEEIELPPTPDDTLVWLPMAPQHLELGDVVADGTPTHVVGNGYIRSGVTGATTTIQYDLVHSAILNDGRLPSVGVEVVGLATYLTQADYAGQAGTTPFSFWGYHGQQVINWMHSYDGLLPPLPASGFCYDVDYHAQLLAAGVLDAFDHAKNSTSNAYGMQYQIGGAPERPMIFYCRCWWLVKL